MVIGRDDHRRQIARVRRHQRFHAGVVVPGEVVDVGAVRGRQPGVAGSGPGMGPMVGAGGLEHGAAAGVLARHLQGEGGRVGPVLPEQRPIHPPDAGGEELRQLDQRRGGMVEAEAGAVRGARRGVHRGVGVTQDAGSEPAQVVDVAVAVGVPVVRAAPARGEQRVGAGHHQQRPAGTVDAARNDARGAPEQSVAALESGVHRNRPTRAISWKIGSSSGSRPRRRSAPVPSAVHRSSAPLSTP